MNQQQPKLTTTSRSGLFRSGFFIALPVLASGAFAQTPAPAAAAAANSEIVRLSPFEVSTDKDSGYRASNSIAGTRTDTPIKDIPINIQVFTKDLADDLLIKNQVDFEAYNASLVNGSADRNSDNVIQQSYQNFLFRGFRQNWGLRDGVREYDPIDTAAFSRVEVVKGPAAALYGLAYPGGVMNNITKTADLARSFANLRFTYGTQGDWRASVDANATGTLSGGKIALRYNGVQEITEDAREHSKGSIKLSSFTAKWEPFKGTEFVGLAEDGYRAKPSGLGYFQVGETGAAGNQASIPLQVLKPGLSWDWNWADGQNTDSLAVRLYRGQVTQKIGDQFQVQGYVQYSRRLEISGNGWDANGSGGADSWESAGSGYDPVKNTITSTYHYRDWGNAMHAYGATAVYKADFDAIKNTFTFGSNVWAEKELSRASRPLNPAASAITVQAVQGVTIPIYTYVPSDVVPESDGGPNGNGYHHEDNSNDYYFANWQMTALDGHLKTNLGINKTNIKTIAWDNGASKVPSNIYISSKVSPLIGAVYEVTREVSLFAVHATSLFPDSTKDSFGHQFSPQVGSSYEGGIKFDLDEGKISGTVSIYSITQTGGTQSSPNAPNTNTVIYDGLTPAQRAIQYPAGRPLGDIIQGGEQKSKGFDIDVIYSPIRQLQIVGSFANTDHKFTESAVPSTLGETFPQAIKTRYSLLTKYTFTDGDAKGLSLGLGISGGSKALQDYQNFGGKDVARYEPARMTAELFAGFRAKLLGQSTLFQLNVKNLTKADDYVGWKATGSSSILATEKYAVPTHMVVRFTVGLDF